MRQMRDCTEAAQLVHMKYIADHKPEAKSNKEWSMQNDTLSDNEIIDAALRSKSGAKFKALLDGDYTGYPSQSEADQAFCNQLAFWCAKDSWAMDAIFRRSGLMRPKWDEKRGTNTYGEITIQTAINGCTSTYHSRSANPVSDFAPIPGESLLINFADVEPEEVEWLWYPYIPKGKITTVQGDPGSGKTFLMAKIAAIISTGSLFPGDYIDHRDPGNSICQNGEDGLADTIVPRLIACGADRRRISMISEEHRALTLDNIPMLTAAFQEVKPVLFIIDPIQQYLGADKDMHRANEVRPVLSRVAKLCEEFGTACVIVMHMNKGEGKAMYRALGSIDFAAIARSQLLIGRDRNNPNQNLLVHTKSSLAPYGPSMAFQIKGDAGLDFLGESLATADDILKEAPAVKSDSALAEALELVRKEVSQKPVWSTDMEEKAIEKGIAIRTLNRAKQTLKDSGEIQMAKAPGLQRWYIKQRGAEIAFNDMAPGYAIKEDCQTTLPNP